MKTDFYIVFDVESVGLHGEGFAVGAVVLDLEGNQHEQVEFSCPPYAARGSSEGFNWVANNCPKLRKTHQSPRQVRAAFWRFWLVWQAKSAVLVADCAWPVEARFLLDCVGDKPLEREWRGPYPLLDLACFLVAKGKDPLEKRERKPNEMPEHSPLADALQSARTLTETLLVNK